MNDQEQIFLRDDLHTLSAGISQANFNLRKFKQAHCTRLPKPMPLDEAEPTPVAKIHTEPTILAKESKSLKHSLRSALKITDSFIPAVIKQPNTKLGRSSKRSLSSNSISGSALPTEGFMNKSRRKQSMPKGLFRENVSSGQLGKKGMYSCSQKTFNKDLLQKRHLQNWLNSILTEYCGQQHFDLSISNPPLKKFCVDENSLLSKGVKEKDVIRIYKSFFVYGIGFNNFLREVTRGNKEAMKNLWTIYAMMLEYCADGTYESLVGEMERDKMRKISQLQCEIEKKQQIIEKNEELNEVKNDAIFRQIKHLRELNANLANEKNVLQQQFLHTDQAFCEQVGLRLKFETKINELYGLHRELGIKHHKLYNDFLQKVEQIRKTSEKYFQVAARLQDYKESLSGTRERLFVLERSKENDQEYVAELVKDKLTLSTALMDVEKELANYQSLAAERELKMNQYLIDKQNMEAMMQLRSKSAKETHNEYQVTLEENNQLYLTLSEQRKSMEGFESQKRDFNKKIIKILSECSFFKRKFQESEKRNEQLQKKEREAEQKVQQMQLREEIAIKELEQCKEHLQNNYDSIQSMHKKNQGLEEQLDYLHKFEKGMKSILEEKDQLIKQLRDQLQTAVETNQNLLASEAGLSSKLRMVELEIQGQREAAARLGDRMRKQHIQMQYASQQRLQKQKAAQSQLEKYKILFNDALTNLKNQKFQRNTLNSNYMQTLHLLEKKNVELKSMGCTISTLREQVSSSHSKYQLIELNMFKMVSQCSLLQDRLEKVLQQQRERLQERANHVHPMQFQDLVRWYEREVTLHNKLKRQHAQQCEQYRKQLQHLQQQLVSLAQTHQIETKQLISRNQLLYQEKLEELNYQINTNEALKEKLRSLQELASTYSMKIEQRTTSEREEIYRLTLEEKSKQIDGILGELRNMQDELLRKDRILSELAKRGMLLPEDNHQQTRESEQNSSHTLEEMLREQLQRQFQKKINELTIVHEMELERLRRHMESNMEEQIRGKSLEDLLRIKNVQGDAANKLLESKETGLSETLRRGNIFRTGMTRVEREAIQSTGQARRRQQVARRLRNTFNYYH